MVSSLLNDFKCLQYGEYVLEELWLILQKTPNEMVHLSREVTFIMDALVKLTPSERLKNEVSTKLNEQFPCIKNHHNADSAPRFFMIYFSKDKWNNKDMICTVLSIAIFFFRETGRLKM